MAGPGVYPGSPVAWGFPSPNGGSSGPFSKLSGSDDWRIPMAIEDGKEPGEPGGTLDTETGKKDDSGGWVVGIGPSGGSLEGKIGGVDMNIHIPFGPKANEEKLSAFASTQDKVLDKEKKSSIFDAFTEDNKMPWMIAGGVMLAFFLFSRK